MHLKCSNLEELDKSRRCTHSRRIHCDLALRKHQVVVTTLIMIISITSACSLTLEETLLETTELSITLKDECYNSDRTFTSNVLKCDNYPSYFHAFLCGFIERRNFSDRNSSI